MRIGSPISQKDIQIRVLIVAFIAMALISIFIVYLTSRLNTANPQPASKKPQPEILRQDIVDRNGKILAINVPVYDLIINPANALTPSVTIDAIKTVERIAKNFNLTTLISIDNLNKKITTKAESGSQYIRILKDISPDIKNAITATLGKSPYLYWKIRNKRFYTAGKILANVVGVATESGEGQTGIELKYNNRLRAQNIFLQPNPLKLSIDLTMQIVSSYHLENAIKETNSESGVVLVVDVKTGEILVNSISPSFDPNNRSALDAKHLSNAAFMTQFEPGSTIKPIIMASLLQSEKFKLSTIINLDYGNFRLNDHLVLDEHIEEKELSVHDILVRSSNVGMSKMILKSDATKVLKFLDAIGFGYYTDVGFPGEKSGFLRILSDMQPIELASMSYGYGIEVTMAQLAGAYQTIANNGVHVPLSLLAKNKLQQSSQTNLKLIKNRTVKDIMFSLGNVVNSENGTGKLAYISGYPVGGKTGTVRAFNKTEGTYGTTHRVLFVGIARLDNPELIIAVMLNKPQSEHRSGGILAAPLFAKIAKELMVIKNIAPNQIPDKSPLNIYAK